MNHSGLQLLVVFAFFAGALAVIVMSYNSFKEDLSTTYSSSVQQYAEKVHQANAIMEETKTDPFMEDLDSSFMKDSLDMSEELLDAKEIEALEDDLDDMDKDLEL